MKTHLIRFAYGIGGVVFIGVLFGILHCIEWLAKNVFIVPYLLIGPGTILVIYFFGWFLKAQADFDNNINNHLKELNSESPKDV